MICVIDIEANSLENPTHIWCIVCKDAVTGTVDVFRNVVTDKGARDAFLVYASNVQLFVGHNILGYDGPVLRDLIGFDKIVCNPSSCIDTLIISKLVDYSKKGGHSVEAYGIEFGVPKGKNYYPDFFKQWSQELEDYCARDVEITHRIYNLYLRVINDIRWRNAIKLEHQFQLVVNSLHNNGFSFNVARGSNLLETVTEELAKLDKEILNSFTPKLTLIREIHPELTKHGTLHRKDFRFVVDGDLSEYNGGPFSRCSWVPFNPSSHKQIIGVLHSAGWKPVDRTSTHIDVERAINKLKRSKQEDKSVDLRTLNDKLLILGKYGWKINENNLSTLPSTAPSPARTLALRILYESRRRTLTEWISLVQPDNRIHGKFIGLGAWTHRMAHQMPNTANIPNDLDTQGKKKLLGKELRSLWQAPSRKRLLVGVDAEGIQLRIFAHYIDDKEFTESLVKGKKDDKTDPHSLNARILGSVCPGRAAAKRFIYALLLGAGIGKLAEILGCSKQEAQAALDRLMRRYQGFSDLKQSVIPHDAKRGWFYGLDGRTVKIPGETLGDRKHLCMSGYLQNGEAIIMKKATLKWHDKLKEQDSLLVNLVHDEWQTETPNNMEIALLIAKLQADSLENVGQEIGLKCPLAGSYWNDDSKDYTIGTNWSRTH